MTPLRLRSEKVLAFCRLAISSKRGCFQVPVCGVEGAGDDCAIGVEGRATAAIVHAQDQAFVPSSYLY